MVTLVRWKLKPLYFIETILNRIQIKLYQNPVYRKTRWKLYPSLPSSSTESKIIFIQIPENRGWWDCFSSFYLWIVRQTLAVGADFSIFSVSWVWMLECKNGNCYLGTHNYILYWYLASLTAQLTISHVTSIIGNWILKLFI